MKIFSSLIFIVTLLYSFSILVNTIYGVFSGVGSFFCYFSRAGNPVSVINDQKIRVLEESIGSDYYYYPSSGLSSCRIFRSDKDLGVANPNISMDTENLRFDFKINGGYISGSCGCVLNGYTPSAYSRVLIGKSGLSVEVDGEISSTNNTLHCSLVQKSEDCSIPKSITNYFYFSYISLFITFLILFVAAEFFSFGGFLKTSVKIISIFLGRSEGYILCNPITHSFSLFQKFDLITVFKGDVDISEEGEGINCLSKGNINIQFDSSFKLLYLTLKNGSIEIIPVKQLGRIRRYLRWVSIDPKNCITDSKGHFLSMKEALSRINEGENFGVSVYSSSRKFFCGEAEDNFSYILSKGFKKLKETNVKLLSTHNILFFGSPNYEAFLSCLKGKTHFKDRPSSVKNKQWKIYVSDMSRIIGCKCGEVFKESKALKDSLLSRNETKEFTESVRRVEEKIVDVLTTKKPEAPEEKSLIIPVVSDVKDRPYLGGFLELSEVYKFGSLVKEVNKKCADAERSFFGVRVKKSHVVSVVESLNKMKSEVLQENEEDEISDVEEIDSFGETMLDVKRLSTVVSKLRTEKGERSLRSDPLLKRNWDDIEKKKKLFTKLDFEWKKIESLNKKSKNLSGLRLIKKACIENIDRITSSTVAPLKNYYDCLSNCTQEPEALVKRVKLKNVLESVYCLNLESNEMKNFRREVLRRGAQSSSAKKIKKRKKKEKNEKERARRGKAEVSGANDEKVDPKEMTTNGRICCISFIESRSFIKRGQIKNGELSEIVVKIASKGIGKFLSESLHKHHNLNINAVKSIWSVLKQSKSYNETEYLKIFGEQKHKETFGNLKCKSSSGGLS